MNVLIFNLIIPLMSFFVGVFLNEYRPSIIRFMWIKKDSKDIRKLLLTHQKKFKFYFREGKEPKIVQFLTDGTINNEKGFGANNETYWEIKKGCLVIYNSKREVFNRFYYCHKTKDLVSTNDPDIQTEYNQRITPMARLKIKGAY